MTIEGLPALISAEREAQVRDETRRARAALVHRRQQDRIRLTHQRAEAIDQLSKDLAKAMRIRALVSEIETNDDAPPASKRLGRWASLYADHLDPLQDYRLSELD